MKKTMKIYMAAALLAVVSPAILAQAPVKVVCNELKQKGNELVIDAVITVDGSRIKSRENLSLTPVLESASQKEGLPSILLNGRISQKVYDREIALNNLQDEPRFLVVQAGKSESVINYKTVIPFERRSLRAGHEHVRLWKRGTGCSARDGRQGPDPSRQAV